MKKNGGFQRRGNSSRSTTRNDLCHKCGKQDHFIKEYPMHKVDYNG